MSLKQAIEPYQTKDGVVHLVPGELDDNPHLFSTTYLHLSGRLAAIPEEYDDETDGKYNDYVDSCLVHDFEKPIYGLFHRSPFNLERIISHDEMIAIALHDRSKAKQIVQYGRSNLWCFDNRVPNEMTLRGFQGRRPAVIAFYKARAREKLNLYDKLAFTLSCVVSTFIKPGETSGKILTYLMLKEMNEQKSWLMNLGIKVFNKYLVKTYKDLSGLLGIYYGKDHPFTIFSKGLDFNSHF